MKRKHRRLRSEADLDITAFMNLMIVLVPVLLMMMVFSKITVLELKLPPLLANAAPSELENKQLELLVSNDDIVVYYPSGYLIENIPLKDNQHDFFDYIIV